MSKADAGKIAGIWEVYKQQADTTVPAGMPEELRAAREYLAAINYKPAFGDTEAIRCSAVVASYTEKACGFCGGEREAGCEKCAGTGRRWQRKAAKKTSP